MKTTPKSSEQIQAQVADYIHESLGDTPEETAAREHLFQDVGRLAAGPAVDHEYIVQHEGGDFWDIKRQQVSADRTLSANQYAQHLRRAGGGRNERIQARTDYQQAYEAFRPAIAGIVDELHDGQDAQDHDAYLHKGRDAAAFGFELDGKQYVAKLAHDSAKGGTEADKRLLGLVRGKGIPHLEQLAAVSYEDGVAVVERMPGHNMHAVELKDAEQATVEQFTQVIATMRAAHKAGITFDPNPENVMYDPKKGFGFIDYSPTRLTIRGVPTQSFAFKVGDFAAALSSVGNPNKDPATKEEFLATTPYYRTGLGLLYKYRAACEAEADRDTFDPLREDIDEQITILEHYITENETPGWIEQRLAMREKVGF